MKKFLLGFAFLVILAGVILWVMGKDKREITTEIEVSAPIEDVWNILVDIDEWASWSPIINQSAGEGTLGSTLGITMMSRKEGEDGPKYNPVITILDAPKSLRWRAKMMAEFVFTNEKVLLLEETKEVTRVIHKETFSGMMVPLFWSSVEREVPNMLNLMNRALKSRAEHDTN